ncbi:MAG: hypothetical protein K0S74_1622 [Chlamydiales bacterium]|jgi:hypothetical protein|nr:hypothetical protein [Chlamydiales bacterium]
MNLLMHSKEPWLLLGLLLLLIMEYALSQVNSFLKDFSVSQVASLYPFARNY